MISVTLLILIPLITMLLTGVILFVRKKVKKKTQQLNKAHENYNPVNDIMYYGQLILDMNNQYNKIAKFASEIISETKRCFEWELL